MKKRLPSDVVIFTLLTCNIYYLYWVADTQSGIREKTGSGFSAGVALLLFFFTAGIYPFIWWYGLGEKLQKLGAESNNGLKYMLRMLLPACGASFFFLIGLLAVFLGSSEVYVVCILMACVLWIAFYVLLLCNMSDAQHKINEIVLGSSADNNGGKNRKNPAGSPKVPSPPERMPQVSYSNE